MKTDDKTPAGEQKSPPDWSRLFHRIAARRDLTPCAKLVHAILGGMQGKGSACWPSYATIAERAGISRTQAIRAVRELERAGEVRVVPGGHRKPNLISVAEVTGRNLRVSRADRRKTESEPSTSAKLELVTSAKLVPN